MVKCKECEAEMNYIGEKWSTDHITGDAVYGGEEYQCSNLNCKKLEYF